MAFSAARLKDLTVQWGLDGGGYSWENPKDYPALAKPVAGAVIWENPDHAYFLGEDPCGRGKTDVLALSPGGFGYASPHFLDAMIAAQWGYPERAWPNPIKDRRGYVYDLCANGTIYEHETECFACEGHGTWENEKTGHTRKCTRCGGDGVIPVEAGSWACYVMRRGQ
jgi:hypothetical protein